MELVVVTTLEEVYLHKMLDLQVVTSAVARQLLTSRKLTVLQANSWVT